MGEVVAIDGCGFARFFYYPECGFAKIFLNRASLVDMEQIWNDTVRFFGLVVC